MPTPTNHVQNLPIIDMVGMKLSTLITVTEPTTEQAVSLMCYEIMTELEKCFKVRYRSMVANVLTELERLPENEKFENIGDEQFYKILEKSIVADLVCMQWLFKKAMELAATIGTNSTGTGTDAPPATIIKKAEAGSANVEFMPLETKNVPMLLNIQNLMSGFKASAERKALTLGCVIDINDDMVFRAYLNNPDKFINPNFLIVRSGCQ